jgi:hypothetical protein
MWRLAADFVFTSIKPPVTLNRAAFHVFIPTTEDTKNTERDKEKDKGEL